MADEADYKDESRNDEGEGVGSDNEVRMLSMRHEHD